MTRPECDASGGDHVWENGGARDHGRYSCSRCKRCLNPMSAVHDAREWRARAEAAERVVEAARAYFAVASIDHEETGIPPQSWDEEPTCVGCIVEGGLNAALLAYDAAKAVPRG